MGYSLAQRVPAATLQYPDWQLPCLLAIWSVAERLDDLMDKAVSTTDEYPRVGGRVNSEAYFLRVVSMRRLDVVYVTGGK